MVGMQEQHRLREVRLPACDPKLAAQLSQFWSLSGGSLSLIGDFAFSDHEDCVLHVILSILRSCWLPGKRGERSRLYSHRFFIVLSVYVSKPVGCSCLLQNTHRLVIEFGLKYNSICFSIHPSKRYPRSTIRLEALVVLAFMYICILPPLLNRSGQWRWPGLAKRGP